MNRFERDLQSLRRNQYFLYFMIFSLVTIVIWVGIGLLNSQKRTQISPELKKLATPLNPNLDLQVILELESLRAYNAAELRDFPIYKLLINKDGTQEIVTLDVLLDANKAPIEPSPSPQASPTPSSSETTTQDQTATPAATTETDLFTGFEFTPEGEI